MSTMFRYEARSATGKLERGAMSAASQAAALERLHRRRLTPVSLRQSSAQGALDIDDRAARDLSRALTQMLRAGLPLTHALRFASEELTPKAARVAERMLESAEAGDRPSQALEEFTGPEARLLKGVLGAGETNGRLAEALDLAADAFARAAEFKSRAGGALIYPAFVCLATLATLLCFLFFVVPSLAQAFAGFEDRLPASTRSILDLSAWLRGDGALVIAVGLILFALALASPPARRSLAHIRDWLVLQPVGAGIAARLEFSAYARLAALSLGAGVGGGAAFEAAALGVRNTYLRARLEQASASIRSGEHPSRAIARLASPPRAFVRLMQVGEETGSVDEALRHASKLLSEEAEQRLERVGAIAGPAITLGLGALVAAIVMSMFLGLLSLSEVALA